MTFLCKRNVGRAVQDRKKRVVDFCRTSVGEHRCSVMGDGHGSGEEALDTKKA